MMCYVRQRGVRESGYARGGLKSSANLVTVFPNKTGIVAALNRWKTPNGHIMSH